MEDVEGEDDPRFTRGRTLGGLSALACLVIPAAALIAGTVAAVGFVVVQYFAAWGRTEGDGADDPCRNSAVRVIEAAWQNDADKVGILLARGADPNRRRNGVSALDCALRDDSPRSTDRAETVSTLLEAGADPDVSSGLESPIAVSATDGDLAVVVLLLDAGADPTPSGLDPGVTPARLARAEGHDDVARLLERAEQQATGS